MLRLILLWAVLSSVLSAQVPELLYLKFNEGMGVVTADDSLVGMPGVSPILSSTTFAWSPAAALGPFCLVQFSAAPTCSMQAPLAVTGDWTIEFWYQQSGTSNGKTVFSDLSAGGLDLKVSGNPTVFPEDLRLLGPFGELVIADASSTGPWVHLAIVNDLAEGTMRPFVNGVARMPWIPTGTTDLVGTASGSFSFPASASANVDEFRIWDRALTHSEILSGMNSELTTSTTDLLVSAINSPIFQPHATQVFGASETVSCEIMNVGTSTIVAGTQVSLSYVVDSGSPAVEVLALPTALAPGDRLPYSFTAPADFSALGPQTLIVTAQMAGDLNISNDARSYLYGGSKGYLINNFPWTEDFEEFPSKDASKPERMSTWTQEIEPGGSGLSDQWAFYRDSPGLPGVVGGARGSSVSPLYVAMRSPLLDLRGLTNPRLRLELLSDTTPFPFVVTTIFSIDVVSHPGDIITPDVFGPIGNLGPGWKNLQIDLASFAGQLVHLRFRIDRTSVVGQVGQAVYLDNLLVTDHPLGNGQASRPGLALFDLNTAVNVGMNVPSYGEPGPYFVGASPGDPLIFAFEGGPAQPVLLVSGPLNPVAATFPNIGQLDIGGPVDPMTGIPLGLSIVFDGNQPGGLNGLFITGPSGQTSFGLTMPPLPMGILSTFQAVLRDPTTGLFVIGNAIELTVN